MVTLELELELIQSHMAQKPMLRGEVGARALRVRSDVRGHGTTSAHAIMVSTIIRGASSLLSMVNLKR